MRILVVEDGFEYSEMLQRFLPEMSWERAGDGGMALSLVQDSDFDAVYLDMRFDRTSDDLLLGDLSATADRFNGDPVQALAYLQDHQGLFVLKALREITALPVVLSYDFTSEPRRWGRIQQQYAPVAHVSDVAGPDDIRRIIHALVS